MRLTSVFTGVFVVMIVATAVVAQDSPKRDGQPNRPGQRLQQAGQRLQQAGGPQMAGAMMQRLPIMLALDTDKDGSLSVSEIENAAKSLAKLDKDGDGILSPEELRPDFSEMGRDGMARPDRPGQDAAPSKEMMARMFESRDADKDGKLSGDEIPERLRENLARVDENGDGALQKSELEKAMSRLGDRAGQARGAKGDKDGAGVKPRRPPVE